MTAAKRKVRGGWMAILGTIIGVPAAIASAIGIVEHFRAADPLEVSVVSVESVGRPSVKVTLRNTTADPLVLTRAEMAFDTAKVTDRTSQSSTELVPVPYTWIVTGADVERKMTAIPLSLKLDGKEPAVLTFVMGFEQRNTTFDASATLRVTYNDGRHAESRPIALHIVNDSGDYPRFEMPANDSELIIALRQTETPFAVQQIIDELAKRRVGAASQDAQRLFNSSDLGTRTAAANYFSVVRDPSSCAGLAKLIVSKDPQLRRAAITALAAQGPAAIAEIERLSDDENAEIRGIGLTMLGDFPGERSINRLRRALDDRAESNTASDEPVLICALAIRALARLHAVSEGARIVRKLSDPDTGVASAAIDAVVDLQFRDALPDLRQLAKAGNVELRTQAAEALAAMP